MTAGPLMGSVNKQREIGDATTTGLSSGLFFLLMKS